MTQNQIAYWNLQEQMRHNRQQEDETRRSNRAQEDLKADIQSSQKDVNQSQIRKNSAGANYDVARTGLAEAQEENVKQQTRTEKFDTINSGLTAGTKAYDLLINILGGLGIGPQGARNIKEIFYRK